MLNTTYVGYERKDTNQAKGYSENKKPNPNSMIWPYAAGAIASNADDLATWDAAISAGKLLKIETWKQIFTPFD